MGHVLNIYEKTADSDILSAFSCIKLWFTVSFNPYGKKKRPVISICVS